MTHVLGARAQRLHDISFHKPVGAVIVRRDGNRLCIAPGATTLAIARWDTKWVALPEDIGIWGLEGRIKPAACFWITVESFDPYHLVCDRPEPR